MNTVHVRVPSSPPPLLPLQDEKQETPQQYLPSIPASSGHSCLNDDPVADPTHHESQKMKQRLRRNHDASVSKTCAVCGDFAKNMHFGGVACDSCKAFFRRSIQSNSYSKFKCSANEQCPIVKNNRRLCQYCRFQKCQRIGMEIAAVMGEAERIALWKKKLAKRRETSPKGSSEDTSDCNENGNQNEMHSKPDKPLPSGSQIVQDYSTNITEEEIKAIRHLVTLQELVFSSMPYPENCVGNTTETLANLFFYICQKLRCLIFRLEDFHEIPKDDQIYVLRNGIAMSIYIHGAYNYDSVNETWPADGINEALKLPGVTKETLKRFTIFPEVYDALMNFYNKYGRDMKDEAIVILLCLIASFHVGNENLVCREYINKINNRYVSLLRNYLVSKRGSYEGNLLLAKLLRSLFDIKKLVSYHSKVDVRPSVKPNSERLNAATQFQIQMTALTQLLKGKWHESFPEHSSAFTAEETVDLELAQRYLELSFRRPQAFPDPRPDIFQNHHCHHHLTNAIFGSRIRTDEILPLSTIFNRNKMFSSYHSSEERHEHITCREQSSDTSNYKSAGEEREEDEYHKILSPVRVNGTPFLDENLTNTTRDFPQDNCYYRTDRNLSTDGITDFAGLYRDPYTQYDKLLNSELFRDCLYASTSIEK